IAAENEARLMREGHVTLTAPEREWQEVLRKDWEETGWPDSEEDVPTYSAHGDCGRMHMSKSAACACANVRAEEARLKRKANDTRQAAPRTPAPVSSAPARPAPTPASTPTSSAPARPAPAQAPAPTRASTPTSSTPARPVLPRVATATTPSPRTSATT